MAKVLLTFELGSGLGHLNRLIAVARGLKGAHDIAFAVPDPTAAEPAVRRALGPSAMVLQGIDWHPLDDPTLRERPTCSFADVLSLFDFANPDLWQEKIDQWRSILDATKPDLLIADFSPALRVATGDDAPLVVVGNGFTVPPGGQPLPPMRPWETVVPDSSQALEQAILRAINAARSALGLSVFDFVADVFSSPSTFACTMPLFDPYQAYRTMPAWRPFNVPHVEVGPTAGGRSGPAIFVYMPADHPLLRVLLEALNAVEMPVHVYVTGQAPEITAARCKPHIGVLRRPADLADVLPRVRLLIHHAGLGTAYAGMMAGTPQFLLPRNLEHLITARGLISAGIAQGFSANTKPDREGLRRGVAMMIDEPGWLERARAEGERLKATLRLDPLQPILDACESLIV